MSHQHFTADAVYEELRVLRDAAYIDATEDGLPLTVSVVLDLLPGLGWDVYVEGSQPTLGSASYTTCRRIGVLDSDVELRAEALDMWEEIQDDCEGEPRWYTECGE